MWTDVIIGVLGLITLVFLWIIVDMRRKEDPRNKKG